MGIRLHVVCFEQIPSLSTVKRQLCQVTGLALDFVEEAPAEDLLAITNPALPGAAVTLEWIETPNRCCIRVESLTMQWNYVEASVIYLLKALGGAVENEYPLPDWAGESWAALPPALRPAR